MMWIMIALQIALIAYVYADVLTKSGQLLSRPYAILTNIANNYPRAEWFLNPVMLCSKCVAGQMAFLTLILYGHFHFEWVRTVLDVLFFLSISIFLVKLLTMLPNE